MRYGHLLLILAPLVACDSRPAQSGDTTAADDGGSVLGANHDDAPDQRAPYRDPEGVHQCADDGDCVVAYDADTCCCPSVFSRHEVQTSGSLFETADGCPAGSRCPSPCYSPVDGTNGGHLVARCEETTIDGKQARRCVAKHARLSYLLWQAPQGVDGDWPAPPPRQPARHGPAIEINALHVALWSQTDPLPAKGTQQARKQAHNASLSAEQADRLSELLQDIDWQALPRAEYKDWHCHLTLHVERCAYPETCEPVVIAGRPADLRPALDALFAWFDAHVAPLAPEGMPMPAAWCRGG